MGSGQDVLAAHRDGSPLRVFLMVADVGRGGGADGLLVATLVDLRHDTAGMGSADASSMRSGDDTQSTPLSDQGSGRTHRLRQLSDGPRESVESYRTPEELHASDSLTVLNSPGNTEWFQHDRVRAGATRRASRVRCNPLNPRSQGSSQGPQSSGLELGNSGDDFLDIAGPDVGPKAPQRRNGLGRAQQQRARSPRNILGRSWNLSLGATPLLPLLPPSLGGSALRLGRVSSGLSLDRDGADSQPRPERRTAGSTLPELALDQSVAGQSPSLLGIASKCEGARSETEASTATLRWQPLRGVALRKCTVMVVDVYAAAGQSVSDAMQSDYEALLNHFAAVCLEHKVCDARVSWGSFGHCYAPQVLQAPQARNKSLTTPKLIMKKKIIVHQPIMGHRPQKWYPSRVYVDLLPPSLCTLYFVLCTKQRLPPWLNVHETG